MERLSQLHESGWSERYHNGKRDDYTWETLVGFVKTYRDNLFDPSVLFDDPKYKGLLSSLLSDDGTLNRFDNIELRVEMALAELLAPIIREGRLTFDVYRDIAVDEEDELDLTDLGVCWTYNPDNKVVREFILPRDRKLRIHLEGTVEADDINWYESLLLYLHYDGSEDELRVNSQEDVELTAYKVYDRWTDELIREVELT